jgi:hypothetical protein
MPREYYRNTIEYFLKKSSNEIIGEITINSEFSVEQSQTEAWKKQIDILRNALINFYGAISFEYSIPRMGKRIDAVVLIRNIIFVIEFKIGQKEYLTADLDQVVDYALDLKNFHEPSHDKYISPILVASEASMASLIDEIRLYDDGVLLPIKSNGIQLRENINIILNGIKTGNNIQIEDWWAGRYSPTPTIIEAAMALYKGHSVEEIIKNDAIDINETSNTISEIIKKSKINEEKSICFVTGVPGSGKTLVGLNIANKHMDRVNELYSVFLSGNGPLVSVLTEALARDKVSLEKKRGNKIKIDKARREVKAFIQNIHHFRDDCLVNEDIPPVEHVVLFDEAQRAWNLEQTAYFMRRKKNIPNFNRTEPEFLISCLERHRDWAVIVCLVGGGQEINKGEGGISEWIEALNHKYPEWKIYISSRLIDSEYGAGKVLESINHQMRVTTKDELHLSVSMRSYRSEKVSLLVKQILDLDKTSAKDTLRQVSDNYPILISRDINLAKRWIKSKARGSERYGIVVSSQAVRLKPYAIDVRPEVNPIHWFLSGKGDTRSSFYLEDVVTEFQVQGLELDWTCVVWDADFCYTTNGWQHRSFTGNRWKKINKPENQIYQKNAYRVLLTRARQGMVIVIPPGDEEDPTRKAEFYDPTYKYLSGIGLKEI